MGHTSLRLILLIHDADSRFRNSGTENGKRIQFAQIYAVSSSRARTQNQDTEF